jgi:hypothetical protein
MKLLIAGVAVLATATGVALFTDFSPATLFIGGAVCTFLGVIDLIARPGTGSAVSAGDMSDAHALANLQRYGSVDGSARFID